MEFPVPNQHVNWMNSAQPRPLFDDKKNCIVMMEDGLHAGMWKDESCEKKHVVCEAAAVHGTAVHLDDVSFLI